MTGLDLLDQHYHRHRDHVSACRSPAPARRVMKMEEVAGQNIAGAENTVAFPKKLQLDLFDLLKSLGVKVPGGQFLQIRGRCDPLDRSWNGRRLDHSLVRLSLQVPSIASNAYSNWGAATSNSNTPYPARAAIWAIPLPIWPAPTTPIPFIATSYPCTKMAATALPLKMQRLTSPLRSPPNGVLRAFPIQTVFVVHLGRF